MLISIITLLSSQYKSIKSVNAAIFGKWMIIILLILSFLHLKETTIYSQHKWQIAIGGTGEDVGYSITQTTDGSYVVAGTSISYGGWYIVKLNENGSMQWNKVLLGTDHAYSIIRTADGGFAVCGEALWDFCIIKFDNAGNMQWGKTVGGYNEDRAYGVCQTSQGDYILGGWTRSFPTTQFNYFIVKLSGSGEYKWSRSIGGSGSEYAYSITATIDGGCAIAGYTNSYGDQLTNMFIVKLDSAGIFEWSKTFGQGNYYNEANSIIQTTDGGYIAAGETTNCGASCGDFYIVKLDNNGNIQWNRTIGGSATDIAWSILQTNDGGYSIVGNTPSFGAGMVDLYLVKLDNNGLLQWSKTVGGQYDDYIFDHVQTTDGGYAAVGYTHSYGVGNYDMYVVKLDSIGSTCSSLISSSIQSGTNCEITSQIPPVISPTPTIGTLNPSILVSGSHTTICIVGLPIISNESPKKYRLYQNYPNPFNPVTTINYSVAGRTFITLQIFDALGRQIEKLVNEIKSAGDYEVLWNASSYPSGIYFYRLTAGEFSEEKKMVLIK